jgi:hypothetical protein
MHKKFLQNFLINLKAIHRNKILVKEKSIQYIDNVDLLIFKPVGLVSDIGWIFVTTIYPKIYDRLLTLDYSSELIRVNRTCFLGN